MAPFKIVLVRHGESEWNEKNLFCGWHDADLTDKGRHQAGEAGRALKDAGHQFDIAYTSALTRAQSTLHSILAEVGQPHVPVVKTWKLNERHFGGLTGLNKSEAAAKYGQKQVTMWRNSFTFDVPLPPMEHDHPYHRNIVNDSRYADDPNRDQFPKFETLKSAVERTLHFWNDSIVPQIRSGKRIIVASHENPLRGIIQHLDRLTDEEIMTIHVPNAVPFVYTLDNDLKPIKSLEFLGDPEAVKKALEAVRWPNSKIL